MRAQIQEVRAEIFRLAKEAPDLETMHWYMCLDDCFENDEFHARDFSKAQWRLGVLRDKGEIVGLLARLITPVLQHASCVDASGEVVAG